MVNGYGLRVNLIRLKCKWIQMSECLQSAGALAVKGSVHQFGFMVKG